MTCPAYIEQTAKLYNPKMKMDVLAIPPRADDTHVCCKWQLSRACTRPTIPNTFPST